MYIILNIEIPSDELKYTFSNLRTNQYIQYQFIHTFVIVRNVDDRDLQ